MNLVLIFLGARFLKIVPALAQLIVNRTGLPIHNASLKAVSDDQVIIGLSTSLTVPGGLTVQLDPIDLYLHNENTPEFSPYTMVPLHGQSVSGKTDITIKEQTVDVGNRTELNTWLTRMLYSKETDISVKGNTTAHLGALHFNIELDKTVTIAALDTLRGFSLEDARIKLPAADDGTNLLGNLTLPNWSDLTIGLGNLTFNAWVGEILIGTTSVFNVLLPPGNNTLPFQGQIFMDTVLGNLLHIVGAQGQSITQGVLEIAIGGNKTTVDGEHITYLEKVLNPARIISRIPILQLLTDAMGSIRDGDLSLDGLTDVLGDGIGSLLDDLFGGGDEGGGDGDDSNLADEIFGDRDENSTDHGILGDLLDELDMKDGSAKRKCIRAIMEADK